MTRGSNSPLYDDTDLQVFSQEIRLASTGEGAVPVAGRRVLPAVRSRIRADAADAGLRRADPGPDRRRQLGLQRAARYAVLLAPDLRLQAVRAVRRSHLPLQSAVGAHRRPALLRLRGRSPAHLRGPVRRPGLHRRARFDELRRRLAARDPRVQPDRGRAVQRAGRPRASGSAASTIRSTSACARPTTSSPTAATRTSRTRRRPTTRSAPRPASPMAA